MRESGVWWRFPDTGFARKTQRRGGRKGWVSGSSLNQRPRPSTLLRTGGHSNLKHHMRWISGGRSSCDAAIYQETLIALPTSFVNKLFAIPARRDAEVT